MLLWALHWQWDGCKVLRRECLLLKSKISAVNRLWFHYLALVYSSGNLLGLLWCPCSDFFSMCLAWMFYSWAGNPVWFLCLNAHLRLWIFRYFWIASVLYFFLIWTSCPTLPRWPFTPLPPYLALLPCLGSILSTCFLCLYPPRLQSALLGFKFPKLLSESVCRPPLKQSILIASRKPLY